MGELGGISICIYIYIYASRVPFYVCVFVFCEFLKFPLRSDKIPISKGDCRILSMGELGGISIYIYASGVASYVSVNVFCEFLNF